MTHSAIADRNASRIAAAWRAAGLDAPPPSGRCVMGAGLLGPIDVAYWAGRGPVLRVWWQTGERGTVHHRVGVEYTVEAALLALGVPVDDESRQ